MEKETFEIPTFEEQNLNSNELANLLGVIAEKVEFEDPKRSLGTEILINLSKAYLVLFQEYINKPFSEKELIVLNSLIRGITNIYSYRKNNVDVTERKAKALHPSLIENEMSRVLYVLNYDKNISPIEKAAIANCAIYYIQPFEDGNKRLGRLIGNKILLENKLRMPTFKIRDKYINTMFEVCENLKKDKATGIMIADNLESYKPMIDLIKKDV